MKIDEKINKYLNKKEVSLTIIMPIKKFQELKNEINIKTTMGQLNPKQSIIEKLSVYYVIAVEKGDKLIRFKG